MENDIDTHGIPEVIEPSGFLTDSQLDEASESPFDDERQYDDDGQLITGRAEDMEWY